MFLKIDEPTDRAGNGPWRTTIYKGREISWCKQIVEENPATPIGEGPEFLFLRWSDCLREEEKCRGEQIATGRVFGKDGRLEISSDAAPCVYLMGDDGQTIEKIQ